MTNKKPFKLQRGCHTFAIFFAICNAHNNKQDGGNLPLAKDELRLAHSEKLRCTLLRGCYTQTTCLATLRKVEGRSTFLATRDATICSRKMGCYTWVFCSNLQRNVCCIASCKKIASCNMAFNSFVHAFPRFPSALRVCLDRSETFHDMQIAVTRATQLCDRPNVGTVG